MSRNLAPDGSFLSELDVLLQDCVESSARWPEGAPGAEVAALEARFVGLKERWLAWVQTGGAPSVDALRARLIDWHREHPPPTERARELAFDRWIAVERLYKIELGVPPRVPPEERVAVGEVVQWLSALEEELRYAAAMKGSTSSCDCAGAGAIGRAPKGSLEEIGDADDGYYVGTRYRCRVCGAAWTCLIMDDSVGSGRWSRG